MTMLEKAARALWTEACNYAAVKRPPWRDLPEADRKMALACARAVLMAVREPDDNMTKAGGDLALSWRDAAGNPGCNSIFTAMIDAILNEGPSNG